MATSSSAKRSGVVRYTAGARYTERRITPADWRKAGVEGGKLVEWTSANGHEVPAEAFDFLDEEQFNRFVVSDSDLKHVTKES